MRDITPASGIVAIEYLASTVGNTYDSVTLGASTVTTTDDDGKKYLNKGVVICKTVSGVVGPYDNAETDGRQLEENIIGINDTFADLSNGTIDIGVLTHGVVKESKINMTGTQGDTLTDDQKGYLRSAYCDITFIRE